MDLEGAAAVSGTLHLAQAQSNRGAAGRKKDFPDAERLVKRLVAQELTLSYEILVNRTYGIDDDWQSVTMTVYRSYYLRLRVC
jgi:hypothetical protein